MAHRAAPTGDQLDADVGIVGAGPAGTVEARTLAGAGSLVRRSVASAFRRDQLSVATGFFAHGVTSHEITIRFAGRPPPPGYFWSFPRPDHLAFGVCAQADATGVDPLRESALRWMRAAGIGPDVRLERYSWPIPSLGSADLARERPAAGR